MCTCVYSVSFLHSSALFFIELFLYMYTLCTQTAILNLPHPYLIKSSRVRLGT